MVSFGIRESGVRPAGRVRWVSRLLERVARLVANGPAFLKDADWNISEATPVGIARTSSIRSASVSNKGNIRSSRIRNPLRPKFVHCGEDRTIGVAETMPARQSRTANMDSASISSRSATANAVSIRKPNRSQRRMVINSRSRDELVAAVSKVAKIPVAAAILDGSASPEKTFRCAIDDGTPYSAEPLGFSHVEEFGSSLMNCGPWLFVGRVSSFPVVAGRLHEKSCKR